MWYLFFGCTWRPSDGRRLEAKELFSESCVQGYSLYMLFALNSEGKKIYISDCVCFNWTIITYKELVARLMSFNVVYKKLIKVQNPSFRRNKNVLWEMEYINNYYCRKSFIYVFNSQWCWYALLQVLFGDRICSLHWVW